MVVEKLGDWNVDDVVEGEEGKERLRGVRLLGRFDGSMPCARGYEWKASEA